MMRLPSSKLVALLLGLGALADARAATLTLDRDVVPIDGTLVFHITTELVETSIASFSTARARPKPTT
jgi:hypothetical protein